MAISKNNKKKSRKKPSREIIEKREAAKREIAAKAKAGSGMPVKSKRNLPSGARGPSGKPMLLPASGGIGQAMGAMEATHSSKDLTKGGKCSGCGACCSSVIPVTDTEAEILKGYAEAHGIKPELPGGKGTVMQLQCPFLDKDAGKCLAYPVRPGICRSYRCDKSDADILRDYLRTTNQKEMPKARNLWELFGKTGLRTSDGEITTENANRAELIGEDGTRYPVQVGRPITFLTKSGKRYAASLCLNLMETAMQVFNDGAIETVEYQDIKAVDP